MNHLKLFFIFPLVCCSLFASGTQLQAEEQILPSNLYINQVEARSLFDDAEQKQAYSQLLASLSKEDDTKVTPFYHVLKRINHNEGIFIDDLMVTLSDSSAWTIGWFYEDRIKNWRPGERLKISYHSGYSNNMEIENIDRNSTAWGILTQAPSQKKQDFIQEISREKNESRILLDSGNHFTTSKSLNWKIGDSIFIFHTENNYELWNMDQGGIIECTLVKSGDPDILKLESKLNNRVLAQSEAIKAVSTTLLNYSAGLNDPNTPIGVFLFLGPTGTGKTELAKAIASEYFEGQDKITRFDMSHFAEPHSFARLIGSPPGYMNHEEGGQLTNAIMKEPHSIILLDEIEKAHGQVRKIFLPAFDEGYIKDNKNRFISCKETVFIMTSNLYAQAMAELFNQGFESDEVLEKLEPYIMEKLSPELYNRVQPILFRPLPRDVMHKLVDLMLEEVIQRLKTTKNITLIVDSSAKEYLEEHGFHPTLGARPLKKLIEKKVTAAVAYALISEGIPNGSTIILSYDAETDSWHVDTSF